ncbi:cell wall hydrolase [Hephaestia sp. GCM10023244]|uniref:cell wall hydrolase n=1 Tax=unclassified Hephaestia TaxID=2631281 RepID=UPI002077359A|nr:cell wall hydrolase [Hephaestia sp. MAHUQ-44]MCM8731069.1 cell wall hydrolase [Hephaestia sp. MAHUQ-44]
MDTRIAFGLLTLIAATSCVATAPREQVAAVAIPVPPPAKSNPVVPPGPSEALLAHVDAPSLADAATLAPAPAFVAAAGDDARRALDCLTQAVYYEARSESLEGQQAVAQVVLNRVRNPAFPNSVCGTVYEGSSRSTGCQFTFTCDGSLAARREPGAWESARAVAQAALSGFVYAPVGSATFYHTNAVNPGWAARVTSVGTIGAHIFYRLPGVWGGALAYRQPYGGVEPGVAPGTRFAEKATEALIEAIEAGVRVHRGSGGAADATSAGAAITAATAIKPVERQFGVNVHRGPSAAAVQHGVTIHTGGAPDEA